jgi:hypothetical protein
MPYTSKPRQQILARTHKHYKNSYYTRGHVFGIARGQRSTVGPDVLNHLRA